jgi:hypothetical protein
VIVRSRAIALIAFGALGTLLATDRAVDAQRPARQQGQPASGFGVPVMPDMPLRAGWQVRSYDGCRFAVPALWHAAPDGSSMSAADGSNLSVRTFRIASWSDHKAQLKAAFGRVNVMHEDSDRRLWFEIGDRPRVQHYIDVLTGAVACSGLLEIRTATTLTTEDVNRIADSIGPA